MKYIRTKNGHICKIRNKQKRLDGEYDTWYVGNNVSLLYNHDHNSIDKEADTIEELCDEFISVRDNWHDHWDNFQEPKTLCSESDVYGAIWTDKGLIYVAKMNEKGELELL